jgi:hypothetical protein
MTSLPLEDDGDNGCLLVHNAILEVSRSSENIDLQPSILPSEMAVPTCFNMFEVTAASGLRAQFLRSPSSVDPKLAYHFRQGLAYTTGAALGETAPSRSDCRGAFTAPNRVGLTAGGRAWQKHAHRSGEDGKKGLAGWWGRAHGSVATINEKSLELFEKVRMSVVERGIVAHAI